ncbi:MAG: response regulator transcription factor [Bacteroidales bacterium]|nr:response regulator transcription factor [Bacteroidales bacterium]
MNRILVVDDEQDICEILQFNLETEGYEVVTANSAEEALSLPLSEFSLILLDVMMGEVSGFEMARKMKDDPALSQIPIIFITALDTEDDIVKGLNIGADDYIAKPLSMKEVKARVAAVLRRNKAVQPVADQIVRYGGLTINRTSKVAQLEGVPLQLTKLEFELLQLFLSNVNKVFSREELLDRCWPHDVCVIDRTVDVNITRLRKKIGEYGKQIKTRVGYGYYFLGS